jgi:hypothetical protein
MKRLLMLAAMGEALTGLLLLVYPPIVVRLLFNAQISGAGMVMSRVAGIALIALGTACWPDDGRSGNARAFRGMLCYSLFVTPYLAYLGLEGAWGGSLLWPTVVLHLALTILLVRAWSKERKI